MYVHVYALLICVPAKDLLEEFSTQYTCYFIYSVHPLAYTLIPRSIIVQQFGNDHLNWK